MIYWFFFPLLDEETTINGFGKTYLPMNDAFDKLCVNGFGKPTPIKSNGINGYAHLNGSDVSILSNDEST